MKPTYLISSLFSAAVFLLLLSLQANAAPIYQWVDAQGKTWFSDQPPSQQPGFVADIQEIGLQTKILGQSAEYKEQPYSILNQVAFFQDQSEKQQKMRLDRLVTDQAIKQAQQASNQSALPSLDSGVPAIIPLPQYPLAYNRPYPRHRPVHHNALPVQQQGVQHTSASSGYPGSGSGYLFNLSLGNPSHSFSH